MEDNKKSPQVAVTTSEDGEANSCECSCKCDVKKIARELFEMQRSNLRGSSHQQPFELRRL